MRTAQEIAQEIRESDTWDSELVDCLISLARDEDKAFDEKVAWAYDFRENNYNLMGYFIGDDEDTRYEFENNIDWQAWAYEAAEILGVDIF